MRIAVDVRELVGKPTGVGRYLAALLDEWASSPDAGRHEWRLVAHGPVANPVSLTSAVEVLAGSGGTGWEQWALARWLARNRPDVLFAPGYTAPLTARCPIALTIHDVSFAAHPGWFSRREGTRRRVLTAWSGRRAAIVLTVSMFSRAEIVRHFGIPAAKIRVIPHGITRVAEAAGTPAGDAGREPIVLFVGSLFRRRHVDRLITAFAEHVAPRVPASRLEIVGENRMFPPQDLDRLLSGQPADIRGRVSFRAFVDDQTLHHLYRRAMVFAFPSEYEGFGLTPLEALAAGVPPIVLDTSLAREVYGAAARYVPGDPGPEIATLAEAMIELLTLPQQRAAILRHAGEVLTRYDWQRAAAATLDAIEAAAGVH